MSIALWLALGMAAVFVINLLLDTKDSMPAAHMADLVRLPRPNSGTFSFAEAQMRKNEIYANKPTGKIDDWNPPECGAGFAIHINANDGVDVDNFCMVLHSPLKDKIREITARIFGSSFPAYKPEHYRHVSIRQLKELVSAVTVYSEPASISVTSARPLVESRVFPGVLDTLFQPFVQISYVPQEAKIRDSGPRK